MKKAFKTVMTVVFTALLVLSFLLVMALASPAADNANIEKPVLKFNSDGKFRILMINDTQDTDKTVRDTIKLIESSLDAAKPDLVVLAGDNIADYWLGVSREKVAKAIDNIVKPINDRNIPFAVVFGNHDQETGISKEEQMLMYMSYKNCLAFDEGPGLSNCGTYNLLVKDSKGGKNIFNIWMIDSGTSASGGGYQSVNADQIAWYQKKSNELKNENGCKPLPSLLFQHIPVPEIYNLLSIVPKGTEGAIQGFRVQSGNYYILNKSSASGFLREAPCSPDVNSGEFGAWLKQGDILGAYFGHDHVNDFMGKVDGIDLGYTPGAGFYQYGPGVSRGVRVFDLNEADLSNYKTEVLHYSDLVSNKADTTIFNPTFSSVLRVAIPLLLTAVIIFLLIALFAIAAIKSIKHKRIFTMNK